MTVSLRSHPDSQQRNHEQGIEKILFLQPRYAHYRADLFSRLSKRHAIHFLFEDSGNTYPGKEQPREISHTFIARSFKIKFVGLAYYLFKYHPDIVISSISTSIRTIISFFYTTVFRKRFILWILEWKEPVCETKNLKCTFRILRYWIGKKIIVKSHAVVVGGTAARNYVLSIGKSNKDIFLAPQCSKDIQQQEKCVCRRGSRQNRHTFLFLSRIIPWKGLDILIRAFCLLRNTREDVNLLIAGDGPSRSFCHELCKLLKIEDIQFIGSVDSDKTRVVYEKADIFVLPSYLLSNHYEVWGLVVNEAMSMSLPVIATTAVGASYDMIIDGHNGFVVQQNSVVDLYHAMDNILNCDLVAMGTNARTTFDKKNDFAKMADGFTDAIAHVSPDR